MSRLDDLIREHCPRGVEYKSLGSIGAWYGGGTPSKGRPEFWTDGTIPWVSPKDMGRRVVDSSIDNITEAAVGSSATKLVPATSVAMVVRSSILDHTFPTALVPVPVALNQDMKAVVPFENVRVDYLGHVLNSRGKEILRTTSKSGGSVTSINSPQLMSFRIPVPPLEVQREIVRILDQFTQLEAALEAALEAELEARRRQYEHYRRELLDVGAETPIGLLGDLAKNLDSRRKPVTKGARTAGSIPYYGASGVVDHVSDYIFDGDYLLVSEDGANLLARSTPIAFSITGKTWVNNHAHVLEFETYAERRFVEIYLNSIDLGPFVSGAAQPKLNKANLNRIPVPNPPIEEKQRVVALVDRFDALVSDLSIGLPAELAARRKQYEYYRDRLLTFEEAAA